MSKQTIGILMLNTSFPRLPGDIGNAASFRYPTLYRTIDAAVPANIVTATQLPAGLADAFTHEALELQQCGATLVTTSCGFLSVIQETLATRLPVPVITSSLTLLPWLSSLYGSSYNIGVLTFDADKLGNRHLPANSQDVAIEGLLPADTLRNCISTNSDQLDRGCAEAEVLACADRLLARRKVPALVLECTNMAPYKHALREHTGCAVYDLVDAVHWLMDAT